ncbi:MAG TPA: ATP-binding protein [Candidatus Binatia bacterium]|nr:ATP-binding protein [Candidatus Binatia bacterium]
MDAIDSGELVDARSTVENTANKAALEEQSRETESLAEIGATAAVFAHAVANPLSGISTTIQLLRQHLTRHNDRFATGLLQDCSGEIQRLSSLLNEFRSFSRPIRLELETIDLVKIIRGILPTVITGNNKILIQVVEEFESGLPSLNADAEKLTQVFVELCKNAVEAMPQGGKLTLRARKLGEHLIVEIQDTGAGMASRVDVFEPFKTPAGFGLALARRFVRAHGGAISYSSESGRGTTFRLIFPLSAHF